MRPTTVELLDSIAQALEDQVLPVVQDKWGASTLRSAMQLLRHLALRDPLDVIAADALNENYLRAVETIIAARDRLRAVDIPPQIHQTLVDYLQRRLDRERGTFIPVFLSPPF